MSAFIAGGVSVHRGSRTSSFVCPTPVASHGVRRATVPGAAPAVARPGNWNMMAKVSKFGIFSPAVIVVRVLIGEKTFNRIRGKGIAIHSQTITSFCKFIGADPKTRQGLILLAKNNGNTLGFLS